MNQISIKKCKNRNQVSNFLKVQTFQEKKLNLQIKNLNYKQLKFPLPTMENLNNSLTYNQRKKRQSFKVNI